MLIKNILFLKNICLTVLRFRVQNLSSNHSLWHLCSPHASVGVLPPKMPLVRLAEDFLTSVQFTPDLGDVGFNSGSIPVLFTLSSTLLLLHYYSNDYWSGKDFFFFGGGGQYTNFSKNEQSGFKINNYFRMRKRNIFQHLSGRRFKVFPLNCSKHIQAL